MRDLSIMIGLGMLISVACGIATLGVISMVTILV
jgi:hypothetical protein